MINELTPFSSLGFLNSVVIVALKKNKDIKLHNMLKLLMEYSLRVLHCCRVSRYIIGE